MGLNKEVDTPGVIYEEPGKAINIAQSDFYSEAGITMHAVTNAMYGKNSQQSLSIHNDYVSYHKILYNIHSLLLLFNLID